MSAIQQLGQVDWAYTQQNRDQYFHIFTAQQVEIGPYHTPSGDWKNDPKRRA